MQTKNREQWADVMKGVGIITVVVGHLYSGIVHDFLYLFHLPIFFFLSAYFFKPKKDIKRTTVFFLTFFIFFQYSTNIIQTFKVDLFSHRF